MGTRTRESPARRPPQLPTGPATANTDTTNPNRGRAARASVFAPCPGRSWWWLAYICPWCGLGHLGRARDETQIPGPRKARCGRLVVILAARTYRGRG